MPYPLRNLRSPLIICPEIQSSNEICQAYMLIYQENRNVLPLLGESLEGRLDCRRLGLLVHNEEVLLRVRRRVDVLGSN